MLVSALLEDSAARLAAARIENPRSEAVWLLGHTLGVSSAWVIAHPEAQLDGDPLLDYLTSLERRAAREPFAYVVGHREFYGLDLEVTPAVLIPRPETELLVEAAVRACGRLKSLGPKGLRVVDVGTGSGAIAIALAVHQPDLCVIAIDASPGALEVASRNATRHSVAGRIDFRLGDLLEGVEGEIDLLVANLPYIPSSDVAGLMPEVTNHEPLSALDGGPDGAQLIRRTLVQAVKKMTEPAALIFEIGEQQGDLLLALAAALFPRADVQVLKDYAGLDRLLTIDLVGSRRLPAANGGGQDAKID